MKGWKLALILAALTMGYSTSRADTPTLWSSNSHQLVLTERSINSTYLSELKNRPQKTIVDDLLDSKRVLQIQQQYQDMNRDYEMRSQFGILTLQDEQVHLSRVQGFGDSLFGEVRRYQEQQGTRKLERTRAFQDFQESAKENWYVGAPLGAAFMAYKFYFGQDIGVRFLKNTWSESRLRANVDGRGLIDSSGKSMRGKVSLENRLLGTSAMDYFQQAQVAQAQDKYWVSHQRGIPIVDINSKVGYGPDTSLMTAEVSRPIFPHVDAAVDTTRSLNSAMGNAQINQRVQQRIQLKYGINF